MEEDELIVETEQRISTLRARLVQTQDQLSRETAFLDGLVAMRDLYQSRQPFLPTMAGQIIRSGRPSGVVQSGSPVLYPQPDSLAGHAFAYLQKAHRPATVEEILKAIKPNATQLDKASLKSALRRYRGPGRPLVQLDAQTFAVAEYAGANTQDYATMGVDPDEVSASDAATEGIN